MRFLIIASWFAVLVIGSFALGATVTAGRYIWNPENSMNQDLAYGVFWGGGALALGCLILLAIVSDYLEIVQTKLGKDSSTESKPKRPVREEGKEST